MTPPILETERLLLRPHHVQDFADIAALWGRAETVRFIQPSVETPEGAWAKLMFHCGHWQAMGFGIWGLIDGRVGLGLSIVGSMTLGIVIDDTVHFLSKYLRARREQGLDSPAAVRYAFVTVGRALIITSVVLVVGFLILSTSSFELNAGMGLLTAIVIAIALVADFLFLPAILMKFDGDNDEQTINNKLATDTGV